jgi:multimeric flavodoxin WrbA
VVVSSGYRRAVKMLALNCTLKRSPAESSSDLLLGQLATEFQHLGVDTEIVRVADFDVRPGVSADEGDGDEWPAIRTKILGADIVVLGTPIWMGAPSSICKRVAERLDAMLGETDDQGRMPTFGKVAAVAVVGNEDGAHHVAAECFQWLNDTGFTIAAAGSVYWVGEAMGSIDYKDLDETPEAVANSLRMTASSATHVAGLLASARYPGAPSVHS